MNRILLPLLIVLATVPTRTIGAPIDLTTTGQFQVEVKGLFDTRAKVYRSSGQPVLLLITTAAFTRPILVMTAPTSARLLDPAHVKTDPATPDVVRIDPSGSIDDLLGIKAEGANLTLHKDGISITLVPSPPVLGDRTLEEIAAQLPDYRRDAAAYSPRPAAIDKLRQLTQPTEMLVFFGSWCSDCAEHVPRLVRTLQDAKATQLRVTFHGLPPNGAHDPMADALHISSLPTAIIRRDGKEIARLVDAAWDTPEVSLAEILSGRQTR